MENPFCIFILGTRRQSRDESSEYQEVTCLSLYTMKVVEIKKEAISETQNTAPIIPK